MAGLLTRPFLSLPIIRQWHGFQETFADSQLRAQSRSFTGFPFQLHGPEGSAITMIGAKIEKFALGIY